MRRELARELRRVETELRDDAAELRERLEATVTSQGKIWLNLVRQISESGGGYVPTEEDLRRSGARRSSRRPDDGEDRGRAAETPFATFDDDPANPLDPHIEADEPAPPRRSSARSNRGGSQR